MRKLLLAGVAASMLAACGNGGGGNPAEVDEALVQLSLKDSGSGRVEFEGQTVTGADAVFNNVIIRTSELASEDDNVEADGLNVEIDSDDTDIKINELVMSGLDLDEDGKANFSSLIATGLSLIPSAGSDVPAVDVTSESFSVYGPSPELAAWLAGVFGTAEAAAIPKPEAVSFDSIRLSNFLAAGREGDEEGRFAIGTLALTDVTPEKMGEFTLTDMTVEIDPGTDNASRFSLGGITLKGADLAIIRALTDAETEEEQASALVDAIYANPMDPGFDTFGLSDLSFVMQGLDISLPSFGYEVTRNRDGVPTAFEVPEFTLTVDVDDQGGDLGAQIAPMLLSIGLDGLEISGEGESTYDPTSDIATTKTSRLSVANAFVFETTSESGGIEDMAAVLQSMDAEAFANGEQDPQALMMEVYSQLDVYDLTFTLTDNGIVDKVLSLIAVQQNTDPETLRQMAVGFTGVLPMQANALGVDVELATELSAALRSFLTDSGSLTIAFNPEEPFSLIDIMSDPTTLNKERLGFSATTE